MTFYTEPRSDWLRDHHASLTAEQRTELQALTEWMHRMLDPSAVAARWPTSGDEND